ncbi:MAG: hypothetical protein Q4Q62_05355 [Thermoplasmata archaeon]|nr:hypothetical protein [Thermoplasmata archaeon]
MMRETISEPRVPLNHRVRRVMARSDRPMTPQQVLDAIGDPEITCERVKDVLRTLRAEDYLVTAPVPDGNGFYDMGYVRRELQ